MSARRRFGGFLRFCITACVEILLVLLWHASGPWLAPAIPKTGPASLLCPVAVVLSLGLALGVAASVGMRLHLCSMRKRVAGSALLGVPSAVTSTLYVWQGAAATGEGASVALDFALRLVFFTLLISGASSLGWLWSRWQNSVGRG